MSLLQVSFRSAALHRKVPMQVILPSDAEIGSAGPFKTLYLLHGLMDNCQGWTSNTRIERWAMERNLAVVMPSAENSFYVDMPYGSSCFGDFGVYVGKELVEMTRKMFRPSLNREDTFIAGLSMGGFGALRNGLKYSDTFGYIACGTEDYLLKANRKLADFLKANGIDVTYEAGPGMHDWDFWDTYIQRVLEWLPIEKVSQPSITGNDVSVT
jgi:S-formylglutathione hydrolase FrmB